MDLESLIAPLLDHGYLPQPLIRLGIRRQLAQRLSEISCPSLTTHYDQKLSFIDNLRARAIAEQTAAANAQHYEVSSAFLRIVLGPRMKYSSCLFAKGGETLAAAEVEMLRVCAERAGLGQKEGMSVLDLGCGWGSGALYFAEMYPRSSVVAFSNSKTQKAFIDEQAREKSLTNLEVITGDVAEYEFESNSFDRVISIEMFEHMKNYEKLMAKVARALKPEGKLFVHLFCHKTTPYNYEAGWMTEHFFSGGTMPSADLLLYFQRDLVIQKQWWVNGTHYSKTLEHWLSKLIASRKAAWPHLVETYGEEKANTWYNRWQIFFMACSELFAYDRGDTWGVSHYLFEKPQPRI